MRLPGLLPTGMMLGITEPFMAKITQCNKTKKRGMSTQRFSDLMEISRLEGRTRLRERNLAADQREAAAQAAPRTVGEAQQRLDRMMNRQGLRQAKKVVGVAGRVLFALAMALAIGRPAHAEMRGLLVYRPVPCQPGDNYFAFDQPIGIAKSSCIAQNTWATSSIPYCAPYTISAVAGNWVVNGQIQQAITATTSQTITLATFPTNYEVSSVRIKHNTAFAGAAISALSFSLGSSVSGNTMAFSAPYSQLLAAPAANLFWTDGNVQAATSAADTLTGTFTAVGGNLTVLTTGAVSAYVCYRSTITQ